MCHTLVCVCVCPRLSHTFEVVGNDLHRMDSPRVAQTEHGPLPAYQLQEAPSIYLEAAAGSVSISVCVRAHAHVCMDVYVCARVP